MPDDPMTPTGPARLLTAMERFYGAERRYSASGHPADRDALLGMVHPEIILEQPGSLPYGGRWRGREGFGRWLDLFFDAWADVEPVEAAHYPCARDMLISTVTMRARGRAAASEVTIPMCQIIQFRDDLPVHWRNFAWDTAAMLQALGSTTAPGLRS